MGMISQIYEYKRAMSWNATSTGWVGKVQPNDAAVIDPLNLR